MPLVTDIAGSRHRLHDCLRLVSVWVASLDDEFTHAEADAIRARLPDLAGGVPIARMAEQIARVPRDERHAAMVPILELVRATLAESARDPFLQLVVDIAAADGGISVAEQHALMLLADLVERAHRLPGFHEDATGEKFTLPADLADPAAWEERERAPPRVPPRPQPQAWPDDADGSAEDDDAGARLAALAILGLSGEPGRDDVRLAYRRLVRVHHPDRYEGLDAETIDHATRAFQRVQAAYELLAKSA